MSALCFAIADVEGGERSLRLVRSIASWINARGRAALILEGGLSGEMAGNLRRVSQLKRHIAHLQKEGLHGYLAGEGKLCSIGCDEPLDAMLLGVLSHAFDIILVSTAKSDLPLSPEIPTLIPALVIAATGSRQGLAEAAALIERMLGDSSRLRPAGFVTENASDAGWLPDANGQVASELARRWGVPFWGKASDVERIASRILDRAQALPLPRR